MENEKQGKKVQLFSLDIRIAFHNKIFLTVSLHLLALSSRLKTQFGRGTGHDAGHNKASSTGPGYPRPEKREPKPHPSIHASLPPLFCWWLLRDSARPLPVIRWVVHVRVTNSSFDLQKRFTSLTKSLSVAHNQAADTHSLVLTHFDCRYSASKCPSCCIPVSETSCLGFSRRLFFSAGVTGRVSQDIKSHHS